MSIGPFKVHPKEPTFSVSPLGVVPKKLPGEFPLICNLSYSLGSSVNDYISAQLATKHYATVQKAISFVKSAQSV